MKRSGAVGWRSLWKRKWKTPVMYSCFYTSSRSVWGKSQRRAMTSATITVQQTESVSGLFTNGHHHQSVSCEVWVLSARKDKNTRKHAGDGIRENTKEGSKIDQNQKKEEDGTVQWWVIMCARPSTRQGSAALFSFNSIELKCLPFLCLHFISYRRRPLHVLDGETICGYVYVPKLWFTLAKCSYW